jgi:hypothetical protein
MAGRGAAVSEVPDPRLVYAPRIIEAAPPTIAGLCAARLLARIAGYEADAGHHLYKETRING